MATIYKITSTAGEKVYIGSTTRPLAKRWWVHKSHRLTEHLCTSKVLFDEYGVDTCSLEEIEKVDHGKRYERERFWIENTENCVNRYVPGRTLAETQKAYRLANRDKIKARDSERVTCPTCGQNLAKSSLARHNKRYHLSKVETLPQME